MHHTLALTARATPQLRNSLSTQLCHELTSIAPVVTCLTSMTCFAHLPVAEPLASRTCRIKGESFRAHSHLSERSESSKGVSRRIKGVRVQVALCASLQPCTVQPRTLPARTINCRLGCTPGDRTLLIWDAAVAHTHGITTILVALWHTPHYSTAVLAVEYYRNSSSCILGDYCNKFE
jgi:hypothetical protein